MNVMQVIGESSLTTNGEPILHSGPENTVNLKIFNVKFIFELSMP